MKFVPITSKLVDRKYLHSRSAPRLVVDSGLGNEDGLENLVFTTFRQSDGDLLLNTCFPKFRFGFVMLYADVTVGICSSLFDQSNGYVKVMLSKRISKASEYKSAIYI